MSVQEAQPKAGDNPDGTPDSGADNLLEGAPDKGQGSSEARDWREDLPEPLKKSKTLAKFASKEALAKGYVELESRAGNMVTIPKADATADEWGKFFHRVGRPEKADDYTLDPVEGYESSQEWTKEFREEAFAAGLTPAQAKRLWAKVTAREKAVAPPSKAQREQAYAEGMASLKKEWGAEFDERIEYARRFIATAGGEQTMAHLKALGIENDPVLVRLLSSAGEAKGGHRFVEGSPPKDRPKHPYDYMRAQLGTG